MGLNDLNGILQASLRSLDALSETREVEEHHQSSSNLAQQLQHILPHPAVLASLRPGKGGSSRPKVRVQKYLC